MSCAKGWGLSCLAALLAFSCTFQSQLGDATCDREGAREGDRICQNGYWVRTDVGGADGIVSDGTSDADGSVCLGGTEVCNQEDDDCDGTVDEGCPCELAVGTEGVCSQGGVTQPDGTCKPPEGYVEQETDQHCDMDDNDCDGDIDEECPCNPGETRDCYSGPEGSVSNGICQAGTQTCDSDGSWGACTGEVTPQKEMCGDEKDSDCNGVDSNGCECDFNGKSTGVCAGQTRNGEGVCPEPDAWESETDSESSCMGDDNDCDGVVDEGCSCNYRMTAKGVCEMQTRGPDGMCQKPSNFEEPTDNEANCDGADNDCDGTTDEGCPCTPGMSGTCYSGPSGTAGIGACQLGSRTCDSNGRWGTCMGEVTPSMEQCGDNVDSDCDGADSNGCPCDYDGKSQGVCKDQTIGGNDMCQKPSNFEAPTNQESNCDGADNDCDGVVDEGCPCNYKGRSDGICAGLTINQNGQCPEPSGFVDSLMSEQPECDGSVDNNCDGTPDDGCQCTNGTSTTCYTGPSGTQGVGLCSAGTKSCTGGTYGSCSGEVTPTTEQCSDGDDNDCDGATDGNDSDCTTSGTKPGMATCMGDTECRSGKCVTTPSSGKRCAQTIAVTSTTWTGKLGGLSGADSKCQNLMGPALGGTWKAILSAPNTSASQRLRIETPLYNTNGDQIATGATMLWSGSLGHAVEYDESGNGLTGGNSVYVWGGTESNGSWDMDAGSSSDDCNGWKVDASAHDAEVGISDSASASWIINAGPDPDSNLLCSKQAALYCIDGQ